MRKQVTEKSRKQSTAPIPAPQMGEGEKLKTQLLGKPYGPGNNWQT
jgi:hypothetical protein